MGLAATPNVGPHCVEIEVSLVGTVLSYPETISSISSFLKPEHFSDQLLGRIYGEASRRLARGERCDPLTMLALFREDQSVSAMGITPSAFFARLAADANIPESVVGNAKLIVQMADRRHLQDVATSLLNKSKSFDIAENDQLLTEAMEILASRAAASLQTRRRTLYSAGEVADEVVANLQEAYRLGTAAEEMLTTGSADLDQILGGWRRQRLYVLAGRPGMGKTAVLSSLLLQGARKGQGTLIISAEMSRSELIERCLADLAYMSHKRIEYTRMPRGELSADEIERLTNASDTIREMPLIIEETASPTISRIKATATRVARELEAKGQRLGCIGIDYLGLLASSDRYRGNKVAETEEITTGLKAMAKELDTAVVVLSQLSRNVERQENKRPCLADLRWSGSIEQDADVVMFLFREHYYLAQDRSGTADEQLERQDQARAVANQLEISVAKNRGGMLGRVELFCDIGCNVIRDFGGQP